MSSGAGQGSYSIPKIIGNRRVIGSYISMLPSPFCFEVHNKSVLYFGDDPKYLKLRNLLIKITSPTVIIDYLKLSF